MSVESIEKKILGDARAEADRIVAEAESAAAAALEATTARNAARLAAAVEEARAAGEQRRHQKATSQRAAGKLHLLARRAELLDDVFDAAVDRFIADRDGAYRDWLTAQLASVAGRAGTVVPAESDRALIAELLADLKEATGPDLSDDNAPFRGGFLLKGERIDLNLSLDARLADLKAGLLPELAKKAFDAEGPE